MENKDSFERFFQDRLTKEPVLAEDWNTPSELPWENAKIFFPKKKKKRRGFIFFYSMALLSLLAAGIIGSPNMNEYLDLSNGKVVDSALQSNQPEKTANDQNELELRNQDKVSTALISGSTIKDVANDELENLSDAEEAASPSDSKQLIIQSQKDKVEVSQGVALASATNNQRFAKSKNGQEGKGEIIQFNSAPQSATYNLIGGEINSDAPIVNQESTNLIVKKEDSMGGGSITIDGAEQLETSIIPVQLINLLPSLPVASLSVSMANPTSKPSKIIPVTQPDPDQYRWATGISTFRLFSDPFVFTELNNPNQVRSSYHNFNFWLTRSLGKKWSINSGFRNVKFDIDVSIAFEDSFDAREPGESISRSFQEEADVLTIGNSSRSVELMFLDDAGLQDGDFLRLEAELPIDLTIYSLPILFTYQLNTPRINYFLRGGLTFDLYNIEADRLDVAVFNQDNRIVNEPLIFEAIDDYEFGGAILFGTGVQYNLSNRFYAEAGVMVDLFDPAFSTIDIGLHYRF